jgi:cytochrome b6-f complex iron-sulfur subunit
MADKPSTADILAKLRAEKAKKAAAAPPADDPPAPEIAGEPPELTTESADAPAVPKPAAPKPAASKPTQVAGGAPKSTSDILAALRAQKAQKGGAPAAGSEASPKSAAAKKPAAAATLPAGDKPSIQEMVKAARGEVPAAQVNPAAPAKPTLPPMPRKPPVVAKKKDAQPRRNAIWLVLASPFILAWVMFTATAAAATLGLARFMMPNVLVEPPSTFKVGPPSDYPPGTVSTKWKAQFGVWLVHADFEGQELVYALASVCTHLGCTPNWLEGEQKFKCPCHGSGFYITGVNFEGPAPRPLERYAIQLAPDGMLEVDKSRKFQQELGQWEDGASKVEVA